MSDYARPDTTMPPAAGHLSVAAVTCTPSDLHELSHGYEQQHRGTAAAHVHPALSVHDALALQSLAPTDWTFITATVGTAGAHQVHPCALTLRLAADRGSGALPPGHPVDLDYVQALAREDLVDDDGQVRPVLSAAQHAAATHYLSEHSGRADVDFRA